MEWYNFVKFETHTTEHDLILSQLKDIDQITGEALTTVTWNNYGKKI